jgi:hypothetical protein
MFYVTLVIYLGGVLLTAMSWGMVSFAIYRFVTGLGIGGEYAAITRGHSRCATAGLAEKKACRRRAYPTKRWRQGISSRRGNAAA